MGGCQRLSTRMRSFRHFSREPLTEERTTVTYTVTATDPDNTLKRLLDAIKTAGNGGHSFSIIVDENEEFFWDGDGCDSIREITQS
jgi:hypothetical protein